MFLFFCNLQKLKLFVPETLKLGQFFGFSGWIILQCVIFVHLSSRDENPGLSRSNAMTRRWKKNRPSKLGWRLGFFMAWTSPSNPTIWENVVWYFLPKTRWVSKICLGKYLKVWGDGSNWMSIFSRVSQLKLRGQEGVKLFNNTTFWQSKVGRGSMFLTLGSFQSFSWKLHE